MPKKVIAPRGMESETLAETPTSRLMNWICWPNSSPRMLEGFWKKGKVRSATELVVVCEVGCPVAPEIGSCACRLERSPPMVENSEPAFEINPERESIRFEPIPEMALPMLWSPSAALPSPAKLPMACPSEPI